jgi:hypothetical protein
MGAAWRTENVLSNGRHLLTTPMYEPEEGFDWQDRMKKSPVFQLAPEAFYGIRSTQQWDDMERKVQQESLDRQVLESNGMLGFGAAMLAGLVSPTILLPGGQIKLAKTGVQAAKSAFTWGAIGVGLDETVLWSNQELRTGAEAALNIGSGAVLAGLLGGAVKYLTPEAVQKFEVDMVDPQTNGAIQPYAPPAAFEPAGAQVVSTTTPDVGQTLNVGVDRVRKLGPVNYVLNNTISPTARWVQSQLSTGGMYLEGSTRGVAPTEGGEISELIEQHFAKYHQARVKEEAVWAKYKRDNPKVERMTEKEFYEAVGDVLAGQPSTVDEVNQIASIYRNEVYLPMLREAQAAGMEGFADLTIDQATTYFPRMIRKGLARAEESDLLEIFTQHFTEVLTEATDRHMTRVDAKASNLETIADILDLDEDGAAQMRASLEANMATLPSRHPDVQDLLEEIARLQGDVKRIMASDLPYKERLELARVPRQQRAAFEKANKDRLKAYNKERANLRRTFGLLDKTRAGLEQKQLKKLEQIEKIEAMMDKTLESAIRRGGRLLEKLSGVEAATDAEIAKLVSRLEEDFKVIDRAQARIDKMLERDPEFRQLVDDDTVPTEKLSKAEDMQNRRYARAETLTDKLENLSDEGNRADKIADLTDALDELKARTRTLNHKRSVRIEKLKTQAEGLDPKNVGERIGQLRTEAATLRGDAPQYMMEKFGAKLDDAGNVDVARSAAEISEILLQKMLSNNGFVSDISEIAERGPALARTLNIDPFKIWKTSNGNRSYQEFLERDVEKVTRRYLRTMGADVELYRRFGKINFLADGSDFATRINKDVKAAKQAVMDDAELTPEAKEKKVAEIQREADVLKDKLSAQVARLRHMRGMPDDPNNPAFRAGKALLNLNTLRLMGGVVISSLPEIGTVVMRNGLLNTFKHGFLPFVTDLKGLLKGEGKMAATVKEIRYAGVGIDLSLGGRSAALAEIMDEMEYGTKAERGLQWAANNMGKVALFDYYTVGLKSMASNITMMRIISNLETIATGGKLSKAEDAFMVANSIDADAAEAIWRELQSPGGANNFDGVLVPNTQEWKNPHAVRVYRAAISRMANSVVVTPGLERPLWMDETIWGRIIGQFRSFMFSSTQKIMIAAAQEARLGKIAPVGIGAMTTLALGTISYYLWANIKGGKLRSEMQNAEPNKWALEAITRSGLLGVLAEAQKFAERIPALEPVATLGANKSSRSAAYSQTGRGLLDAALGPSAGALTRGLDILTAIPDKPDRAIQSVRKITPYQNIFYLNWLFDGVENLSKDFVGVPE